MKEMEEWAWRTAHALAHTNGHGWACVEAADASLVPLYMGAGLLAQRSHEARLAVCRLEREGADEEAQRSARRVSSEAWDAYRAAWVAAGDKARRVERGSDDVGSPRYWSRNFLWFVPRNRAEAWAAWCVFIERSESGCDPLPPSLDHITATGRAQWYIDERRGSVDIGIYRPIGGCSDPSLYERSDRGLYALRASGPLPTASNARRTASDGAIRVLGVTLTMSDNGGGWKVRHRRAHPYIAGLAGVHAEWRHYCELERYLIALDQPRDRERESQELALCWLVKNSILYEGVQNDWTLQNGRKLDDNELVVLGDLLREQGVRDPDHVPCNQKIVDAFLN